MDVILIVLALLSVAGLALRVGWMKQGSRESLSGFAVCAVWKNVDNQTAECLREGELLYTAAGEIFGRVLSLEAHPAVTETVWGGRVYRAESPSRFDVELRLSVEGRFREEQLLWNGLEAVSVGQTKQLYSRMAEVKIAVTFFEKSPLL